MLMSNNNKSNIIDKITCYAIGCNQNAETNLKLTVENKEISLYFCNNCLVKFKKYKGNQYE